jgi:hypothetical protein
MTVQRLCNQIVNRPGSVRTSFCGKEDGTMPGSRYDAGARGEGGPADTRARGDYPTEYAAVKAVAGQLGMSA